MISLNAAARSLRKSIPNLPDSTHHAILAQLSVDKLAGDIPDDGGPVHASAAEHGGLYQLRTLSAAAAESSDHARLAQWCVAQCARLGFDLDPAKPLDDSAMFHMNAAFANKDVDERMAVKTALFRLGCIAP